MSAPSTQPRTVTKSQAKRPGRPRSATAEAAVIDATLRLLAENGVPGVTIEHVANVAGVAKSTIYRRWPDKHALIMDSLAHMKGPIPEPPGDSVREDLLFLMKSARNRHRRAGSDRVMCKLFSETDTYPELVAACRERIIAPRRARWVSILHRGVDEGIIRPDADLALAADMLVSPLLISDVAKGRSYSDAELEQMLDLLLTGLRSG